MPGAASTVVPVSAGRRKGACGVRRADAAGADGLSAPLSSVVCRGRLGQIPSSNFIHFFKFAVRFCAIDPS